MVTVTTVTLKNIQDKEQKYVVISNGKDKAIINVGDKTFNNVKKIIDGDTVQQKTAKASDMGK